MTTEPRVIITAQYLVEMFGHLDEDILFGTLAPFFCYDPDIAIAYFDKRVAQVEEMPDAPGKQGAIEAWQHLKAAYTKMSPLERRRVAADLPGELFKWKLKGESKA